MEKKIFVQVAILVVLIVSATYAEETTESKLNKTLNTYEHCFVHFSGWVLSSTYDDNLLGKMSNKISFQDEKKSDKKYPTYLKVRYRQLDLLHRIVIDVANREVYDYLYATHPDEVRERDINSLEEAKSVLIKKAINWSIVEELSAFHVYTFYTSKRQRVAEYQEDTRTLLVYITQFEIDDNIRISRNRIDREKKFFNAYLSMVCNCSGLKPANIMFNFRWYDPVEAEKRYGANTYPVRDRGEAGYLILDTINRLFPF